MQESELENSQRGPTSSLVLGEALLMLQITTCWSNQQALLRSWAVLQHHRCDDAGGVAPAGVARVPVADRLPMRLQTRLPFASILKV